MGPQASDITHDAVKSANATAGSVGANRLGCARGVQRGRAAPAPAAVIVLQAAAREDLLSAQSRKLHFRIIAIDEIQVKQARDVLFAKLGNVAATVGNPPKGPDFIVC
jgi:hypothetical protein